MANDPKTITTDDLIEEWRSVPDYEGFYEISNFGRLRSLDRSVISTKNISRTVKGRIIRERFDKDGYISYMLCKNSKTETIKAHKLVCICFLDYQRKHNYTIDHINGVKSDNKATNLRIISHRENVTKSMKIGKSKYRGVDFNLQNNKWRSRIMINSKRINLGYFETEIEAHNAYQKYLKNT